MTTIAVLSLSLTATGGFRTTTVVCRNPDNKTNSLPYLPFYSIIYMVMPVYISEVSPKESRGMLTSLIGIGYAMGALLGLCTNIGFSRFLLGWRVATGVQAVWGLLFSLGMVWMPYTPRYVGNGMDALHSKIRWEWYGCQGTLGMVWMPYIPRYVGMDALHSKVCYTLQGFSFVGQ